MLEVSNLRKEYKNVTAVNDISFKVHPGKIFGLLGPNGAGKTTTIRTILNIIKPTSGSISFEGKPIDNNFNNLIGYLPEERGLYKKSKVIDIIAYFGELKNMNRTEAIKEGEEWLKKLSIPEYRNKKVEELSKGNQQKIQFIVSVIHNPKLLILDEPFSGFDPINQQLIKDTILTFVDSGKIIILSTHQMDTAEKLCSEIFLINKGKEVTSGTISDVKRKFGVNNIHIQFEGDGSVLKNNNKVLKVDYYSNFAEVTLPTDYNPSHFLKEIITSIEIKEFKVIEPTLHSIFIDVISEVGNKSKNGELK